MVKNSKFDNTIMFFILLSTLQLAIENPLNNPKSALVKILYTVDIILTVIFFIEAAMKIIALGFVFNGKGSYLRDSWNVIDFIIVCFSVFSFTDFAEDYAFFKVFRLIRILRPLRVISRNEGLKLCIQSLIMAFPNIVNVTVISFLFFLIFGIIGVNYMKGAYFYCEDAQFEDPPVLDKWDCKNSGGLWVNFVSDFDNISSAMVTLWVMANIVGWAEICYRGVAARGIDLTPER